LKEASVPEWLLIVIGILAAVLIVGGIIALSLRAERPGKKSWMAKPSGERDVPSKYGETPHSPSD
jgi:hypothetical protein